MIVYKITNLINGMSYIGKTVKALERRWGNHLSDAEAGFEYYLHRAIRKYGKENFSCETVCEADDENDLNELEKFCIAAFDTKSPHGYNMTDGGDGQSGRETSAETRAKIGRAFIGKKHPAWHIEKARLARLGIIRTEEFRQGISERFKGVPKTEEHKAKIRAALVGKPSVKRLTMEKAQEIRHLYATGQYNQPQLAEKFQIARTQITKIIAGKSWVSA